MTWTRILRQDVAPVATVYLVFVAVFVWYGRRMRRGGAPSARRTHGPARWRPSVRPVAATLAGGYLVFAAVIAIFYLGLGGQPASFVAGALAQGAVLVLGVVLPAFALLTAAEARWRGRASRRRRP